MKKLRRTWRDRGEINTQVKQVKHLRTIRREEKKHEDKTTELKQRHKRKYNKEQKS